jgi:hypothetical protein
MKNKRWSVDKHLAVRQELLALKGKWWGSNKLYCVSYNLPLQKETSGTPVVDVG